MEQSEQRRGTDDIRVNINDGSELTYWAISFRVSKDEIRAAVTAVGDSLTAIKLYLHGKHQ